MKLQNAIALAVLVIFAAGLWAKTKEKLVYLQSFQGATQQSCRMTHRATHAEPWIDLTCTYRCPHPVAPTMEFTKAQNAVRENIMCSDGEPSPSVWYGTKAQPTVTAEPRDEEK